MYVFVHFMSVIKQAESCPKCKIYSVTDRVRRVIELLNSADTSSIVYIEQFIYNINKKKLL